MSIEERHRKDCASERGKRCSCAAHYRGEVRDARGRKVRSDWSTSRARAVAWEEEAVVAVRRGRLRASTVRTTYNRYGKVVPEDLAPAAAQLEEYFDRGRARLESRPRSGTETGGSVTGLKPPSPPASG